jgi:dihydroorotase
MMPNLSPPVTTVKLALEYKGRILDALKTNEQDPANFQPLMTLYLTDHTDPEEIKKAVSLKNSDGTPTIIACKYYPAGATTNSALGVSDVKNIYPVLEEMQKLGMMLCIHSEVTHADIFEREPVFIEEIMKQLVVKFPTLNITMEHISTKEAVNYVMNEAPFNVKASITPQHLIYNRNRTCNILSDENRTNSQSKYHSSKWILPKTKSESVVLSHLNFLLQYIASYAQSFFVL